MESVAVSMVSVGVSTAWLVSMVSVRASMASGPLSTVSVALSTVSARRVGGLGGGFGRRGGFAPFAVAWGAVASSAALGGVWAPLGVVLGALPGLAALAAARVVVWAALLAAGAGSDGEPAILPLRVARNCRGCEPVSYGAIFFEKTVYS